MIGIDGGRKRLKARGYGLTDNHRDKSGLRLGQTQPGTSRYTRRSAGVFRRCRAYAESSSYLDFSKATTAGSASVVTSPRARPSAISRSRRRMIFPDRVLGRSAAKIMSSGFAIAPIF